LPLRFPFLENFKAIGEFVPEESVLESANVAKLEILIEESTRSTSHGVKRFVEPANGTLDRAMSKQHHLIFGRRGSGKSSLLRKAAADLTIDRRPIAFVDLESFKGHAYPDVLLSVLVETFSKFSEWLDTAAIAPANKTSFWTRLFGTKPTRRPFDKTQAAALATDLRNSVYALRELLFSEDGITITAAESSKGQVNEASTTGANVGVNSFAVSGNQSKSKADESSVSKSEIYVRNKLNHLNRHILDYQSLFRRMATLSDGDAFLILDDLYHLKKQDQPNVIDYFHRIAKGNQLWLKIGTIRHRSQWYINGDPPIGAKIGDDISDIDLDLTLERYGTTRDFLSRILDSFLQESNITRDVLLTEGALDRLVLASGGVTRDFLGLLRRSILIARERGNTSRGEKVGAEDVNNASGDYDSSKREELSRDTMDESETLEREFKNIVNFAREKANANVFLVDRSLPEEQMELIEELVDLRLVHRIKGALTVADRPGKKFEAFMLDLSQYTASRKKREFEVIEFWRSDATDKIRRTGLIYKEMEGDQVVTKPYK
jgi:hypothetical protein